MKKNIFTVAFAALSVFSACAAPSAGKNASGKNNGKILVVYYSASGTTKSVA